MKKFYLILIMAGCMVCGAKNDLPTVESVDLNKYAGMWYEIARLPNSFERGLKCVTATYTLRHDGKIAVLNQGRPEKDPLQVKTAQGTAWLPDEKEPGKLKVRFFWPFAGDYYIIALDADYQYALVGSPSRKYLWILAREKTVSEDVYTNLCNIAVEKGFEVSTLLRILQDCE